MKPPKLFGTGDNRVRIEFAADGFIVARLRTRPNGHPEGEYHRISIGPHDDIPGCIPLDAVSAIAMHRRTANQR